LVVAVSAIFAIGTNSASVSQAAPPANDNAATPFVIPVGNADSRSNVEAGIEPLEFLTANDPAGRGCGPDDTATPGAIRLQATLWWVFTGTGGPTTISTLGSNFDTVIALYDTTTRELLGCNDDVGRAGTPDIRVTSEVTRTTVAGRTYAVQLGGCEGNCSSPLRGTATLRVSSPPANDDRALATPVPESGVVGATNTGATLEGGEIGKCTELSPYAKTVWFRYTAPAAGTATFTVSATNSFSGVNLVMAIYRDDAASPLACNDDAIVGQWGASSVPQHAPAEPPFAVVPGDYLIQVGGYYDQGLSVAAARNGPFALQVVFARNNDVDDDGYERDVDCDDADPATHPGATEIPNNDIDEDCDAIMSFDRDGDGVLAPPSGFDCRDDRVDIHPGTQEVLGNGIDEDCDGSDGIQKDRDGDGVLVPPYGPDCNDSAAGTHPGAAEIVNNDTDENCDTINAFDLDGDGYLAPPAGDDCRDDRLATHRGALEILGNGIDEDCDGSDGIQKDRDNDGVLDTPYGPDCDPSAASTRPGMRDVPENGIDEDCDSADGAFPVLRATISATWINFGTRTDAQRLRISQAPKGSTVELRCEGERCPFRRKAVRVRKLGDVSVLDRIGGRLSLLAGTILEVRVTKPRFTGIARVYRIVRGRGKAPSFRNSCVRQAVVQACPR